MRYRHTVSPTSYPLAPCSLMVRNRIDVVARRGSARARSLNGGIAHVRSLVHETLQHSVMSPAFRDSASDAGKLSPSCAEAHEAETCGFCRSEFVMCP